MKVLEGKVWKFGDNISTDLLSPGIAGFGKAATGDSAEFCMAAVRPKFAKEVRPGDLVVAGRNFGCGSSRPAAKNLITLGVSCVLAESIGAIFFRNSINFGLPSLTVNGVSDVFKEGDRAMINLRDGLIQNLSNKKSLTIEPFPPEIMRILEAGGLVAFLKAEAAQGRLYTQTVVRLKAGIEP